MTEFNARLQKTRTKLLDLSKKNKLINYKKKINHLKIIDESLDFIYNSLILEDKQFKFKSIKNFIDTPEDLYSDFLLTAKEKAKKLDFNISNELPKIDLTNKDINEKYTDEYLQTLHYPDELEKILKKIDLDARSLIQETGVNMLYIMLGVLEWTESKNSDIKIKSPLVNIPVTLQRKNLNEKTNTYEYILKYDGDGLDTNRSLSEKIFNDFNIVLPEISPEVSFSDYIEEVSKIILYKKDWKIKLEISLDFLNFSKILMYKDLEDAKWGEGNLLSNNPILHDLFLGRETSSTKYAPLYDVDTHHLAQKIPLVMDADSSQHSAIVDVLEEKNLVIEGPPGTGKSQTIANIIAALLSQGKSVLFVSEKLAALEVVHKRLSNIDLEDFCLELHSHKSQKLNVLQSLQKRINRRYNKPQNIQEVEEKVKQKKIELQEYLDILHSKFGKIEKTIFEIFWILDRYNETKKVLKFEVKNIESETPQLFDEKIEELKRYEKYLEENQKLEFLFWNKYNLNISSLEVDSLEVTLTKILITTKNLKDKLDILKCTSNKNGANLKISEIEYFEKFLQEFSNEILTSNHVWMQDFFNGHSLEKVIAKSKSYSNVNLVFNLSKVLVCDKAKYLKMKNIIELKKDSFFNFLSVAYHEAKKDLQNLLLYNLPKDKNIWLLYLKNLITYIDEYKKIDNDKKLFERIKNSKLTEQIKATLFLDFRSTIDLLKDVTDVYYNIKIQQQEMFQFYQCNIDSNMTHETIDEYAAQINQMVENIDSLAKWVGYRDYRNSLLKLDLGDIVDAVENGTLPHEKIANVYQYNFYYSLLRKIFIKHPKLERYGRVSQEFAIKEFKKLDIELIKLNRQKVASKASDKEIPIGISGGSVKNLTEQKLIEHQAGLKCRHIPIRQLVARAGTAMKKLKPCFMMSPLSVAQYIPPSSIKFDVLIVDEASQLRPEEALGAIARANQIVIVGDPKQLPPTSFFDAMNNDSDDNDEETVVDESESILDVCTTLYSPARRLNWHYRSQHESLIAFSNLNFYDNDLIVFPSPTSINDDELGIKYSYIQNGVYEKNCRINKHEAQVVIEHIVQQMKLFPKKSLGVGTFNIKQKDFIQELLDEKEKTNPSVANYLNSYKDSSEPFFIKNLESLQGDERDVIFISTIFGPDKLSNKVLQRFGPIAQKTGWRRLNVLITRSKQKMHVFTSMKSNDILVSETSPKGVSSLKGFLKYLEHGRLTYEPEITNGKGFDSPFEESVYSILSNAGIKSKPQVGVAGYFIDLAVVSNVNDDYILAIECDGATYHSSKSARDRDRLKQEVLERLGWQVYRIWSTDWFKNRDNEIFKLLKVVNEKLTISAEKYEDRKINSLSHEEVIVEKFDDVKVNQSTELNLHDKADKKEWLTTSSLYSSCKQELASIKLKDLFSKLRDEEIAKEFDITSPRCILSKIMIDQFVKQKPKDMVEFRSKVSLKLRESIDPEQTKFLSMIFNIIEIVDE